MGAEFYEGTCVTPNRSKRLGLETETSFIPAPLLSVYRFLYTEFKSEGTFRTAESAGSGPHRRRNTQ
ncbi:hypothetical protein GCM10010969_04580 [Saccharibacillus kuerlensis]|uniref:Uncharacterized protein n=1 Tax=Saccharibacillus kuerlensis TaxID=459527 RepID=A0ABQ2KTT2_9BACL|nr:hypothetical protein GCM10010969_04580 [Saccharibacillus kuerlensis]